MKKTKRKNDSRKKHTVSRGSGLVSAFWLVFFSIWGLLISGIFENAFHAPGIMQAIELKQLESERRLKLIEVENEIALMQNENENLQKNLALQEREIRKTLGYVAEDEILFDFSSTSRIENH